ncbi:MAG: type I restriction enzyme HsdR N-terminal domain-containing protein [Ruminococcus flavefaciens]|nr:type I restriction enzyme HsdR N-terminal domain-containing protein [Ruminococcus flavefaciens]
MKNSMFQIITEYQKSTIQSEAEVRSKLIVPLLDILGYPSNYRAEEFPVYGFEGGKRLPAKNADFVLFSDNHFAEHRMFTKDCRDWVYKHSLLIVEAKKPGEMPELLGQPEYYTIWTKAVAYLVIDGIQVKGYFYNNINTDFQMIDCAIKDLPNNAEIWSFSFENILNTKEKAGIPALQGSAEGNDSNLYTIVTEEDLKGLPNESLQYMRFALGKNADGLSKIQLISRFLNTTDAFLQLDLRYDIPRYMFDIPRHVCNAYLYIDDIVLPIEKGEITEFYWENYEKFIFESTYIQICILTLDGKLNDFEIGFRVLDLRVSDRLLSFDNVKRILNAEIVRVSFEDCPHRLFALPCGNPGKMWEGKALMLDMCTFWYNGLEQLKAIEEFYEIEFALHYVSGEENVLALYRAIDLVYSGIAMSQNCEVLLPGGIAEEDIIITEPIVFEDEIRIPLEKVLIQGVCFEPCKSWLLPGQIHMKDTKKDDTVKAAGCCAYKIVNKPTQSEQTCETCRT